MNNTHAASLTWGEMNPQEVREKINQRIMSIEASEPTVESVSEYEVKRSHRNTRVRLYKPDTKSNLPITVLIHGGAFAAGNLDTHDNLARYLCSKTQLNVISIGYLNSPEGEFPVSLEQCYDVLLWIMKHANEFSADSSKIAVVGDSAGGNLAAALCLMVRDRAGPKIAFQVLINPALDLTIRRESLHFITTDSSGFSKICIQKSRYNFCIRESEYQRYDEKPQTGTSHWRMRMALIYRRIEI